jgi:hypothetical protein
MLRHHPDVSGRALQRRARRGEYELEGRFDLRWHDWLAFPCWRHQQLLTINVLSAPHRRVRVRSRLRSSSSRLASKSMTLLAPMRAGGRRARDFPARSARTTWPARHRRGVRLKR